MVRDSTPSELSRYLASWLLRLRARDALIWAVRGLAGGLAAALSLSLVARLRPLQSVEALALFSLAFALGGLATGIAVGWYWPRRRMSAARWFDLEFGLAERVSTALELAAEKISAPEWLRAAQLQDAAAAAHGVDAARQLPLRLNPREALIAATLLGALTASLLLPNPQQPVLAQQQAVRQAIEQQIRQIEAIRRQVDENADLTEAQRQALQAPLEAAQRQLQQGNLTREQAVSVLIQTEQQLQQLTDPNAAAQQEALTRASEALSRDPATRGLGEALAGGDLRQAAAALADIDPDQMTGAQREALAAQLDAAAQDSSQANPELAGRFQQAAEALRSGDAQAARQALQAAAESLAEAASQLAQSQAAQTAATQLALGRQAVTRAGQAQASTQTGQGQGQGSSQSQGQAGAGSGAGRGEGQGEGQGSQVGNEQIGQGNAPGDGGERGYEPIYAPFRVGGSGGPEVALPGAGDPGEEVIGRGPSAVQDPGQATVPYDQVYAVYSRAAYSAIETGQVPLGLRSVVREYFSSLQP